MSDYGDFCRESRQRRQRHRLTMPECAACGSGDHKKVDPGIPCDRCGAITDKNGNLVQRADGEREDGW